MNTAHPNKREKAQGAATNNSKSNRKRNIKPSQLTDEEYHQYELAFRLMAVF